MDVSTHIQTYKIYKDIKLNHKKCIKCIRKCFDLILLSKFLMAHWVNTKNSFKSWVFHNTFRLKVFMVKKLTFEE